MKTLLKKAFCNLYFVIWRLLVLMYAPLLYAMDTVDFMLDVESRFEYERTRIEFLRLWYMNGG